MSENHEKPGSVADENALIDALMAELTGMSAQLMAHATISKDGDVWIADIDEDHGALAAPAVMGRVNDKALELFNVQFVFRLGAIEFVGPLGRPETIH